ncbi:MAG TPA: hypothetical protein VHG92_10440 [Afifellaceae bacterium]|nr:hypothetical protein [Afifellaceae bacterium]
MDWLAPIDLYCERTGPELWAEPLNFVSNGAFLVAAGLLLWHLAPRAPRDPAAIGFAVLIGIIGIGSGLFHLFANRWSLMADVLPIQAFILGYFLMAMRRFLLLGWTAAILATLAFFLVSPPLAGLFAPVLGGSSGYLPGLLAIAVVAALAWRRAPQPVRLLVLAGITFALSLTLRTLDQPLCSAVPIGTHYLWHVLNAMTLSILVLAAAKAHRPAPAAPARSD